MIHYCRGCGKSLEPSLGLMYKSLVKVTMKGENISVLYSLFAELGVKGFCWNAPYTAVFITLWHQTGSLQPTANAEYVGKRGKGRKRDSHKLLIVLGARGQKKYGWNWG